MDQKESLQENPFMPNPCYFDSSETRMNRVFRLTALWYEIKKTISSDH